MTRYKGVSIHVHEFTLFILLVLFTITFIFSLSFMVQEIWGQVGGALSTFITSMHNLQ